MYQDCSAVKRRRYLSTWSVTPGSTTTNLNSDATTVASLRTYHFGRNHRSLLTFSYVHGVGPPRLRGIDSGYGELRSFRKQFRDWNEPYILGVGPKDMQVSLESTPIEQPRWRSGVGRPPTEPRWQRARKNPSPGSSFELVFGLSNVS